MVAHASARMTRMEDPTQCLRQIVTDIEDTRTMAQDDVTFVAPLLDGKVLNLDMSSARSRPRLVDHRNRGLVVDKQWSGARTKSVEFLEHVTKVFCSLRAGDSGAELSLC